MQRTHGFGRKFIIVYHRRYIIEDTKMIDRYIKDIKKCTKLEEGALND